MLVSPFLLLVLTHADFLCHLWGISPYASSWVFLFSGPFVEVLLSSSLRMIPSFLQGVQLWSSLIYIAEVQPRYLYLRWDFCYIVWLQVVFSFSWGILLLFFLSSLHVWWCPFSIFLSISKFPFYWAFRFFSWFVSSFPTIICHFLLFTISMAHFVMPNSIPVSLLYILRLSISFSFFANNLMSMYMRWLIFFPTIYEACIRVCIS